MGRKSNVSYTLKLQIIQEIMEKNDSVAAIAKKYSLNRQTLNGWVRKYNAFGLDSFVPKERNRAYSEDLKIDAVKYYLDNKVSLLEVCKKFNITSMSILSSWIRRYQSNIRKNDLPSNIMKREKTKSLSPDEKMEIVNFCLANGKNYLLTVEKFGITYNQIYNWVKKYKEFGIEGLKDNRGRSLSKELLK